MAQNPLLGSRISLISKKSIRYEGTLYSINESNATVALQNVRSYGTEGREKLDPESTYVAPQDSVHPYLLFRGCDIKDLHVHENAVAQPPADPAIMSSNAPPPARQQQSNQQPATPPAATAATNSATDEAAHSRATTANAEGAESTTSKDDAEGADGEGKKTKQTGTKGNQGNNWRQKKPNPSHQVGTGASLLTRKVRGNKSLAETPSEEFDFQSKLKEFDKEHEEGDDEAGDTPQPLTSNGATSTSYDKDDFFDSISCDAIDRKAGIDNRLRGSAERNLNTETFGAVALNSQRRRRRGGGGREGGRTGSRGGGGRGRGRGRGGGGREGRGRGRGRGRSGGQENRQPQAAASS